jgi:hypothetical protein
MDFVSPLIDISPSTFHFVGLIAFTDWLLKLMVGYCWLAKKLFGSGGHPVLVTLCLNYSF